MEARLSPPSLIQVPVKISRGIIACRMQAIELALLPIISNIKVFCLHLSITTEPIEFSNLGNRSLDGFVFFRIKAWDVF